MDHNHTTEHTNEAPWQDYWTSMLNCFLLETSVPKKGLHKKNEQQRRLPKDVMSSCGEIMNEGIKKLTKSLFSTLGSST